MSREVKFSDMRVGEKVVFLKPPGKDFPLEGKVVSLTANDLVYSADGKTPFRLRRPSLILDNLDRRRRVWTFE